MKLWLPLFTILSVSTYLLYLNAIETQTRLLQKEQQNFIVEAEQIIKSRLQNPQRDILYLANQYALQRYINTNQNQHLLELISSLEAFMESRHDIYSQFRYLNESGQEIIRMENKDGVVNNVDKALLQNKKDRYYFQDSRTLAPGAIYISKFDLNVEHGKVEIPYKPVLRFVSRVYSANGQPRGVVILNFLGNSLLDRLKGLIPEDKGIQFWLLNKDSYWISHPESDKEWGFMFEDKMDLKLSIQQPALWSDISLHSGQALLETLWDGGLITSSFLTRVKQDIMTEQAFENYQQFEWHLVALMTRESLNIHLQPLKHRFGLAYLILLVLFSFLSLWFGQMSYRRQQSDEAILKFNKRMAIAARSGGFGIWEYNLVDNSLTWDDKMYHLYGVAPEDFNGAYDAWEHGVHPEDRLESSEALQEAINGGDEFDTKFRIVAPSGEIRWIQANAEVITDKTGKAVLMIGSNIDITERELRASELEKARTAAELIAQSKSDFLANMSHEIRTPMNAIIGLSGLGLRLPEISPKLHNYLSKIHTSSQALLSILNDILDLSKVESGHLTLESEALDLEKVMLNIIDLFGLRADEKGLELILNISPTIPASILGDSLRLGQIINNLVGNALKFTETGEVVINITQLANEPDSKNVKIRFEIKDTGIGMTHETMEGLFEAFQQGDGSITRRFGGTGLGLTISKQLVEKMGGIIDVDSEFGKGSTFGFTLEFPVVSHERTDRAPNQLRGMRVLIVDDIETSRQVLSDILLSWEFSVVAAASGAEALDILTKEAQHEEMAFELIILDWKMPEMDGVNVAQRINDLVAQNTLKCAPIVMMVTGFSKDELLDELSDVKVDAILTKPVAPSRMFDVIMEVQGSERIQQLSTVTTDLYELAAPVRGAHILLVEDNKINQIVAGDLLRSVGLEVTIAEDGEKAVNCVQAQSFDLVLMDLQMPVMDGFEATRRIRAQSKFDTLPIIAMTAAVLVNDREQCADAGMNSHVAKPIDPQVLIDNLIQWIKPRKAEQPQKVVQPIVSPTQKNENSLPQIAGIDTHQALTRLMGNVSLFRTILKQASSQYKNSVESTKQKWLTSHYKEAASQLHTLRGVLGNIGAMNAVKQSAQLEKAIKGQEYGDVEILFEQLNKTVNDLFMAVDEYLDNSNDKAPDLAGNEAHVLEIKSINSLIEKLRAQEAEALDDYEEISIAIKAHLNQETQQQLQNNLDALRFSEAADILTLMVKTL